MLTGASPVQGDQDMVFIVSRRTGAVEVFRPVEQGHLDSMVFEQLGQIGNGITADGPIF
jgi:hypothetical protein